MAQAVDYDGDKVRFSLTNRSSYQNIVALVHLVAYDYLHVINSVFTDGKFHSINAVLSPYFLHIMKL